MVQEAHIEQASQKLNSSTLQAHVANRDTNRVSRDPSGAVNSQGFTGYHGGRSSSRGGCSFRRSSLTCQLCHKSSHTSFNCWHRFDQNFTPSPPLYAHFTTTYLPPYMPSPPPSSAYPSSYATPARVPSLATSLFSHSASVTMPDSVVDAAWYSDSEASSHATPEFHNLMHASPYHGSNQLHVGNGQGLSISHVGHSKVISSNSNSKTLNLHDLFYVPSITKNLINVSELARDNCVFFEFNFIHITILSNLRSLKKCC